jgi:hypothetical protein
MVQMLQILKISWLLNKNFFNDILKFQYFYYGIGKGLLYPFLGFYFL